MAVPAPVAHAGEDRRQDSIKQDIQGAIRKDYTPVHTELNKPKKQTHDFIWIGSFSHTHTHWQSSSLIIRPKTLMNKGEIAW